MQNPKNHSHPGLRLLDTRREFANPFGESRIHKTADEGGCGVTGFAASIPVAGRHIVCPSVQMHNRGNGKGGGIAAVGLDPASLGVSQEILDDDYLIQIAYLDIEARPQVEAQFITPVFKVDHARRLPTVDDWRDIPGLVVKPPDVWQYFVRVKPEVLQHFIQQQKLYGIPWRKVEDEYVAQNCYKLNGAFYASLGEKKAFVMSQGRNMLILKIVGYAEEVAYYYQLLDFKAHVWIAHQRYPTRGRVWHPGGAHPFAALNTALVHNGDFANYYSVSEYLSQRHFFPQFLTDTEVAVLIFDLWHRLYGYSLEYVIESMAPTTERDFDLLPPERQHVYRQLQSANIHGSPDGPWFFIIARNDPERRSFDLIGITDTSMLRPQVFALQDGEVQIGLICSEKQAIDATLASLAQEDPRICPVADLYWNARGGSATDGGAFIFSLEPHNGRRVLSCHDKFGKPRTVPWHQRPWDGTVLDLGYQEDSKATQLAVANLEDQSGRQFYNAISEIAATISYAGFREILEAVVKQAATGDPVKAAAMNGLTLLLDRRYDPGDKKRSNLLHLLMEALIRIFQDTPLVGKKHPSRYRRLDWDHRELLQAPPGRTRSWFSMPRAFPRKGKIVTPASCARPLRWGGGNSSLTATRASVSWAAASGPAPRRCASTLTAAPATTWPQVSTA